MWVCYIYYEGMMAMGMVKGATGCESEKDGVEPYGGTGGL